MTRANEMIFTDVVCPSERAARMLRPISQQPADTLTCEWMAELRDVLAACGTGGGQISASVYDTAQGLRWCPPANPTPALNWLLAGQGEDGGWGRPSEPLARDTPTLAAVLALHTHRAMLPAHVVTVACSRGLAFLQSQAGQWQTLGDGIPVAAEMNLPRLLMEARELGFDIDLAPYATLMAMGDKRRARIAAMEAHIPAGSPPLYCWEAWGETPQARHLDGSGGVGHSPAATACWLNRARGCADLNAECERAEAYLRGASKATASGIEGVLPVVWPVDRFEQAFTLHFVLLSGLWMQPHLTDVWRAQMANLAGAQRKSGWGMSDDFMADGDDTAAALSVLAASGYAAQMDLLRAFARDDHFAAYAGEMQPSVSLTMRALMTLDLVEEQRKPAQQWMRSLQGADGRWTGDKWNIAWTYNTLLGLAVEREAGDGETRQRAICALSAGQNQDGGWGEGEQSTPLATAYALMGLNLLSRLHLDTQQTREARIRGLQFLCRNEDATAHSMDTDGLIDTNGGEEARLWLSKETYRMTRMDRVCELCAMLGALLEQPMLSQIAGRAESKPLFTLQNARQQEHALRMACANRNDGPPATSPTLAKRDCRRHLRIALIAPLVTPIAEPFVGGAQVFLNDLALGLAKRGHDVTLFAASGSCLRISDVDAATRSRLHLSLVDAQPGELTPANFSLPEAERETLEAAQKQDALFQEIYARIANDPRGFDLAHNHAYDHAAFAHAEQAGILVAHTLHLPALSARIQSELRKTQAQTGKFCVTTVSQACARTYAQREQSPAADAANNSSADNGGINCHVIPNAIPLDAIPFGAQGEGFLLFVGRITPEKRPDLAIAIARQAGMPLVMIGAIYDRAYYEASIAPELARDSAITYLGALPREQVYQWMSRADATLFTSEWEEPFGLVLAESLAAGTPVIAWERGAAPEIVRQGETGFLLPFGDINRAARACRNARSLNRAACREDMACRFSMEACLGAYENYYYQCAPSAANVKRDAKSAYTLGPPASISETGIWLSRSISAGISGYHAPGPTMRPRPTTPSACVA